MKKVKISDIEKLYKLGHVMELDEEHSLWTFKPFNLDVYAEKATEDLKMLVYTNIQFLWQEYVKEDIKKLDKGAKALRKSLMKYLYEPVEELEENLIHQAPIYEFVVTTEETLPIINARLVARYIITEADFKFIGISEDDFTTYMYEVMIISIKNDLRQKLLNKFDDIEWFVNKVKFIRSYRLIK